MQMEKTDKGLTVKNSSISTISPAIGEKRPSKGLTNGNGLTNGTIKKGLVNGNGATNSLTNGLKPPKKGGKEGESPRIRNAFVVIAIVAVLLISAIPYLLNHGEAAVGDIDGNFREWEGKLKYDTEGDSTYDLIAYHSMPYYGGLELYAEAKNLFEGNSTLRALIDSDSSTRTGYSFRGLGADYLIEITGNDGKVTGAMLYSFNGSRSQDDWNGFEPCGRPTYALSGDRIEFGVSLEAQRYGVYFIYSDFNDAYDVSDSPVTGVYARFKDGAPVVLSGEALLGTVLVYSDGEREIRSFVFRLSGTYEGAVRGELRTDGMVVATASSGGERLDFRLDNALAVKGEKEFEVWISSDESGNTIKFELLEIGADCGTVSVSDSYYHYLGRIPEGISIDGGFEDWKGREILARADADNSNIDPEAYGIERVGNSTYIYLRVVGDMLGGSDVPRIAPIKLPSEKNATFSVWSGKERPLPALEGRDFAYLFLDIDGDNSTGYHMKGARIGAEIMLRFSGRNGLERSETFLWNESERKVVPADLDVDAYADGSSMEASIDVDPENISVFYYLVDWRGEDSGMGEMLLPDHEGTRIWVNNDFQISFDDAQSAENPDIAIDPKDPNLIYVVWNETDETTGISEIHFSMSADGGKTWSNDELSEGDRIISASKRSRAAVASVGNASLPAIAVDTNGYIHVIWREDYQDGSYEIHYSYSVDRGLTWSSDSGLDLNVSHRYGSPGSLDGIITSLDLVTLTDDSGAVYLHAFWTEYSRELKEQEVRYSWSKGGLDGGWSGADGTGDTIISYNDGNFADNVSAVAYNLPSTPSIFVVWDEVDELTGMSEIHFSYSTNNGLSWSGQERDMMVSFEDKDGRNARKPSISGSDGVLFALWEQEFDPLNGYLWTEIAFSISTDNGATWSGTGGDRYISYPDKNWAHNVSVAVIPGSKEAHAVWQEYADEYLSVEIHHSYFDGASWSGENGDFVISNPDGFDTENPSVVYSPILGRMEVVWSEPNATRGAFTDEIIYSNPVPEFSNMIVPALATTVFLLVSMRKRKIR